jgi:hypothetical protein
MAVASGWVGLCTRPFTSSVVEISSGDDAGRGDDAGAEDDAGRETA